MCDLRQNKALGTSRGFVARVLLIFRYQETKLRILRLTSTAISIIFGESRMRRQILLVHPFSVTSNGLKCLQGNVTYGNEHVISSAGRWVLTMKALPSLHPGFGLYYMSHVLVLLIWICPTAIPTVENGGNHTRAFRDAAATEAAHDACLRVSKALAGTGIRVLLDEQFFEEVRTLDIDLISWLTEINRSKRPLKKIKRSETWLKMLPLVLQCQLLMHVGKNVLVSLYKTVIWYNVL